MIQAASRNLLLHRDTNFSELSHDAPIFPLSPLHSHSLDNLLKVRIIRRQITFKVGITRSPDDSQGQNYSVATLRGPGYDLQFGPLK